MNRLVKVAKPLIIVDHCRLTIVAQTFCDLKALRVSDSYAAPTGASIYFCIFLQKLL